MTEMQTPASIRLSFSIALAAQSLTIIGRHEWAIEVEGIPIP
jgi:hypothetical protein